MSAPARGAASGRDARRAVDLARELAVDEMHAERDMRPRPGPVRCDVDRRRRLLELAGAAVTRPERAG